MWLTQVEGDQLFERWMGNRARAETSRLELFRLAATTEPIKSSASGSGLPLPLLQLEYFRRYQFDVKKTYYECRGQEHREDSSKAVRLGSYAALAAMLGSALAAGLGTFSSELASIAVLGVVGTALSSLAANRESLGQHKRNAERYRHTLDMLEAIGTDLDRVRDAAAAGDADTVAKFVDAVNDELILEHRQWLKEMEGASKPVRELKQALKKFEAQSTNQSRSQKP